MTQRSGVLRVGRIPYLVARPFGGVWTGVRSRSISAPPRELGEMAAAGELDVALLASRDAIALRDRFHPLGDFGIACRGRVESVLLLSRVPLDRLAGRRIALSTESRTSRGLVRVLLADVLREPCTFVEERRGADAVLEIGDRALVAHQQSDWSHVIDLGEAWQNLTGLPFVYAQWVVRNDLPLNTRRDVAVALAASLWRSLDNETWRLPVGITRDRAEQYLARFRYRLGRSERAGMRRFQEELGKHDLLRQHSRIHSVGSAA